MSQILRLSEICVFSWLWATDWEPLLYIGSRSPFSGDWHDRMWLMSHRVIYFTASLLVRVHKFSAYFLSTYTYGKGATVKYLDIHGWGALPFYLGCLLILPLFRSCYATISMNEFSIVDYLVFWLLLSFYPTICEVSWYREVRNVLWMYPSGLDFPQSFGILLCLVVIYQMISICCIKKVSGEGDNYTSLWL